MPQVVVKKYGYLTRLTPVQMRHGGLCGVRQRRSAILTRMSIALFFIPC